MAIIVTENGKNARKIDRSKFLDEKELQEYLYENPDVVPIYEIEDDIKLLILSREFSTNSGPIDALGIDVFGNLYIVETKLYKNPDKRLVIAQALDYGASMWAYFDNFSEFLTRLDVDVSKKFGVSLTQKLVEFFTLSEDEAEALIENIKQNLNKGVFKFVVLMDELEPRLKDLIRFINQNSQFDVYAVELEYYKFDTHELVIPKIFGTEVKKDINVSSAVSSHRTSWNEEKFMAQVRSGSSPEVLSAIKDIYDFSSKNFDSINWGAGKTGAFSVGDTIFSPRSFYTIKSDGRLVLNLGWHDFGGKRINNSMRILIERLNAVSFGIDPSDLKQHYFYPPEEWIPKIEEIKRAFKSLLSVAP